jgi:NTE family protein
MSSTRQTVSLVLGSGGARGYAHIGVIRWLLEHGYEIRSISGCSMGAVVGGIHAARKLDEFVEWAVSVQKRDIVRLLDPSFGSFGFFKGERIMTALHDFVGDHLIEDLPLKFTAVATDIDTHEEVWIEEGPLFDAIRASISIPTVLTPKKIARRHLVDGGLTNPLPIDPTLHDHTDLTIAVDLSGRVRPARDEASGPEDSGHTGGRRERIASFIADLQKRLGNGQAGEPGAGKSPKAFDLISRSIETMQYTITALKLDAAPPDHLITVPRNTCSFYEFHRAGELIAFGHQLAGEQLSTLG